MLIVAVAIRLLEIAVGNVSESSECGALKISIAAD